MAHKHFYMTLNETERLKVKVSAQCSFRLPEVAFIFHKMSVYSVTGNCSQICSATAHTVSLTHFVTSSKKSKGELFK